MSRETVCRSMYSLMSKRMNWMPMILASCLAISVLPTPVGPVSKNEPIGFSTLRSPARASLMALAISLTAASCPKMTEVSSVSMFLSALLSSVDTSRGGICAMRASTVSTWVTVTTGTIASTPSTGFALASFSAAPASSRRSIALSGSFLSWEVLVGQLRRRLERVVGCTSRRGTPRRRPADP